MEIKTATRVGRIQYINCLPFYHQLQENFQGIEFFESYPAKINEAMHHGKIDIAPISSLEYLNHHGEYLLLPNFSIGTHVFSGSVILFSRQKLDDLNGKTIAVTQQSISSSNLLRILFRFKYRFENNYAVVKGTPQDMLKKYTAFLAIGDDALLYRPQEFVYKYDLSELWWNWTGKPFCFAVWAVRRQFAKEHPEEVREFVGSLTENLNHNLIDLETLIRGSLNMTFLDPDFSRVFGYLFNLHYQLDEPMQEGLTLFYRLAHRLGTSPRPSKLEFFKL